MRAPLAGLPSRRLGTLAAAAVAVAGVLAASACGTGGLPKRGDVSSGKTLFQKNCASCHKLADAGTPGTIGPNLDDAFAAARDQGFEESTIAQVVISQIKFAACAEPPKDEEVVSVDDEAARELVLAGNCMPRNLVRGKDAEAVATYVASVAGKPVTGGGGKITAAGGKEIYAAAGCGSCHTLRDAGSSGTIGPSLDGSRPVKALVVERVTNGKGVMPTFSDRLSEKQIDAVAGYVSSVAGR